MTRITEISVPGKPIMHDFALTEKYPMPRADDVNRRRQTDLDEKGIAKNAREEKKRQRDEKLREKAENERMAALYRKHVLKEPDAPALVQINMPTAPAAPAKQQSEVQEEAPDDRGAEGGARRGQFTRTWRWKCRRVSSG